MGKSRGILKRANTARNIRSLTRTMEMVSTSRFRKSHVLSAAGRPYTDKLTDLLAEVIRRADDEDAHHPLLVEKEDLQRDVLLVLTSNRGLCGAYNQAVVKLAAERYYQIAGAGYDVLVHVAGRKGLSAVRARRMEIDEAMTDLADVPDYTRIGRLAQRYMNLYIDGEISGLEVAYTRVERSGQSRPVIAQMLPLSELTDPENANIAEEEIDFDFYPSIHEVLRNLLPATIRLRLFQCFVDASVAEQMARMSAMRSATENADEMIQNLTRKYNRMRQAQITTELTEIMGGRAGLE
ncbi:MAG: ATP synthase F1 subunit gamma [Phycisphaerae bacterium]